MATEVENFENSTDTSKIIPVDTVPEAKTNEEKVTSEEFQISGDALVARVKELLHEGNVRRIIIKNEEGRTLIEMPLNVGVIGGAIGAAVFPVIAALGAIGAVVAHLTLVIERNEPKA